MNIKYDFYCVFGQINAVLVAHFNNIWNKFYVYGLNTNKHKLKAQKTLSWIYSLSYYRGSMR